MNRSIRIWVPSAREHPKFRRLLIEAAGGLTMTNSFGSWVNEAGATVSEPIVVYEAFFAHDQEGAVVRAAAMIVSELFKLGEEAVLTEINGERTNWLAYEQEIAA